MNFLHEKQGSKLVLSKEKLSKESRKPYIKKDIQKTI